ncbi:hypothetical protein DW352_01105 [Pseudolabrys taiwanensis]|uniref:Uncharacterized protein n=1 Tax=Pseudolabrys taiwanensis TaxID=331696 RepID=A0A345ZQN8_9HYPH|nr:hypothetical protein [Pseudolabrys taiwanensis]AXK79235.1 hypothetical protein DW352_01105 [Pseudolabrys taiwanensis]
MWVPTEAEAVEIFAHHFEARHRNGALSKAKETATELERKGDSDGHRVWTMVAGRIEELRCAERIEQRRTTETA